MNTNKYYFPSSHDTIINYLLMEQTGAKFNNKLINPNVCYNSVPQEYTFMSNKTQLTKFPESKSNMPIFDWVLALK